jgi:hypothetical protein
MMFYVRDPVPGSSISAHFRMALSGLDLWVKGVGKVLNLSWDSARRGAQDLHLSSRRLGGGLLAAAAPRA